MGVDPLAQTLEEGMGLRQPLAAGALRFAEERHGIQPEAVTPRSSQKSTTSSIRS